MKTVYVKDSILYLSLLGIILSLSGILYSIYNILINNSLTLYTLIFGYSLFSIVGILYYLFENVLCIIKKPSNNIGYVRSVPLNNISIICFYVLFTLILLTLNSSMYTKPFIYYLLISIIAVIIGYQIVSNKEDVNKKTVYIILFLEIVPLAFLIRYSSFLVNPYLIGSDTPWHFHSVQKIIENGFLLPRAQHYYYYPSYHLIQSISGLILGFSKTSFNLVNLSISLVSIIVAYLLGTEIFGSYKVGLITSLLFSISTMSIYLVVVNTSKIGGCTLFLLCFFLLIKMFKINYNSVKMHLIFWITSITLFLWHPEVSFALMVLLGGVSLSNFFIKRKFEINTAFILYLISYVGFLIYVHTSLFSYLIQSLFIESPTSSLLVQNIANQNIQFSLIFELFTSYLGETLPIFFVSYFALRTLKKINIVHLFVISTLILLHTLPVFGLMSGNFGVDPARVLVYVSMVSLVVFSGIIFEIFKLSTKKSISIFVLILFIFSFYSVSSYLVGDCSNIFNDEIPIQTTYTTKSVLSSHSFLSKTPDKSVINGDSDTLRCLSNPERGFFDLPGREITHFSSQVGKGYLIINAPYLERLKWRNSSLNINLIQSLKNKNGIYNNDNIRIFI